MLIRSMILEDNDCVCVCVQLKDQDIIENSLDQTKMDFLPTTYTYGMRKETLFVWVI